MSFEWIPGLIAREGQTGTIQKFNAGTGTLTSSYSCTFFESHYRNEDRDGNLIRLNDRKIYISSVLPNGSVMSTANEPTPEDRHVMTGGLVSQIVTVKRYAPAGSLVYFELQLRS